MGGRPNRVALTGLGIIAPGGIGVPAFWDSLVEGKSGIRRVTHFDASDLKSQIAGEVDGFDPEEYIPAAMKPRRLARQTQFALAAAKMALEDARLDLKKATDAHPVRIAIGSSIAALEMVANSALTIAKRGMGRVSPAIVSVGTVQSTGAYLSAFLDVPTEVSTVSTTCASGVDAVGLGMELIRNGKAEVVIAGGTDCPITPVPFASMASAGLCATRNDDPGAAARPFDVDRETGVIAEGCGVVILENLDHARARGVEPYAELTGFSTHVDEEGGNPLSGLVKSMRGSLANAGQPPEAVDSVSAWAPGHPVMDVAETEAIKEVLGEWAYRVGVVSIKGIIGNPFGATGAIMLVAAALSLRENMLPPTTNCDRPDPQCDLDYVAEGARRVPLNTILLNAHGVGGGNSSLVIERVRS